MYTCTVTEPTTSVVWAMAKIKFIKWRGGPSWRVAPPGGTTCATRKGARGAVCLGDSVLQLPAAWIRNTAKMEIDLLAKTTFGFPHLKSFAEAASAGKMIQSLKKDVEV